MPIVSKKPPLRLAEMRERWWLNKDLPISDSGMLIATFFLPISLCKRQNSKFGAKPWQASKDRKDTLGYMRLQRAPWSIPLAGRPYVRCIRFSATEPDKYSDWAKVAIDCLCKTTKRSPNRLNLIFDDAPKYAEIDQQWRKAKAGEGFCVIEVWSGNEEPK